MARLNWCLAAVISWGKFLFACFFPLRGAKRNKVRLHKRGTGRLSRDSVDVDDEFCTCRLACLYFNARRWLPPAINAKTCTPGMNCASALALLSVIPLIHYMRTDGFTQVT